MDQSDTNPISDPEWSELLARFDASGSMKLESRALSAGQIQGFNTAARRRSDGTVPVGPIELSRCVIGGPLDLSLTKITGPVRVTDSRLIGGIVASQTLFEWGASFKGSEFLGPVVASLCESKGFLNFEGATFEAGMQANQLVCSDTVSLKSSHMRGDLALEDFSAKRFDANDAVFDGAVELGDAKIAGDLSCERARFMAGLSGRLIVGGDTDMEDTKFKLRGECEVRLGQSEFGGRVDFESAEFGCEVFFYACKFLGGATFAHAKFETDIDFSGAIFEDHLRFDHASVSDEGLTAINTKFNGSVTMDQTRFEGKLVAIRARFAKSVTIDTATSAGILWFESSVFEGELRLRTEVRVLNLDSCIFSKRISVAASGTAISLAGAELASSSTISSIPGPRDRVIDPVLEWVNPSIIELGQADATDLLLSSVNLSSCIFFQTHGLETLRIDGDTEFASAPRSPRWKFWRARTRRRVIFDEYAWREHNDRSGDWNTHDVSRHPLGPSYVNYLHPKTIASEYRLLRRGLEAQRETTIASDFYFGEMEMRRFGADSRAERSIIYLYWLVSGYGTRAARAFGFLALLVCAAALVFWQWDLLAPNRDGLWSSFLFSIETSISVLRPPAVPRGSNVAESISVVLRIFGPLLFGLGLFSLRERVKR